MKLPAPLSFEWDEGNKDKNWRKHKVHFREAEEVFLNKLLKIFPDTKHSIEENRFLAFGVTNKQRYLAIVFTIREEKIRVISARNQNRKERLKYEQKT